MKKATAILLALAMVLSFGSVAALSADGSGLPEPVDGVITLTGDVTLAERAVFEADTTVDLAGYTLTGGLGVKAGTLTLKDSSEAGTGLLTLPEAEQATAVVVTGASFVQESGAISVSGQDSAGVWVQSAGTAELKGGSVTVNGVGAIGAAAMGSDQTNTVTVSGSSISAEGQGCMGIYLAGGDQKAVVTGGTITAKGGDSYGINTVEMAANGHEILISGGEISASGRRSYAVCLEMDNKLTISGGTLKSADSCAVAYFQGGNTGSIIGGTIEGKTYGVQIQNSANNALSISGDAVLSGESGSINAGGNRYKATPAVTISGGWFNGAVAGGVPSDTTDNYAIYDITGGHFTAPIADSALYNYALAKDYTPATYTDEVKAGEGNRLAAVSDVKDGVTYGYAVQEKVFASGSGTEADPYVIETVAQLQKFAESVDNGTNYAGEYVLLGADLALGSESFNPIGAEGKASQNKTKLFAGTFDGQNHVISGLTINDSFDSEANVGLFSTLGGTARVQNVVLEDVNIQVSETGSWANVRAGGVAGDTQSASPRASVVDGCRVSGNVSASASDGQSFAGGILGRAFTRSAVINCVSEADTSAVSVGSWNAAYAGGIAGMTGNMTVMANCVALGSASAENTSGASDAYAGGLVGMLSSTIYNCYSSGSAAVTLKSGVTPQSVGALAGQQAASPAGSMNYYPSDFALTVKDETGSASTVAAQPWCPDNNQGNATAEAVSAEKLGAKSFVKQLNANNAEAASALNEAALVLRGWKLESGYALPLGEDSQTVAFDDVAPDSYYADAVDWAVGNEVTTGVTPTTFNPNGACTRAQIVTFLWRANGCPEPRQSVSPFSDVKESDYFFKAVLWAQEQGITTGYTPTTFGPNNPCTRAQIVTFLWRAAGMPAVTAENHFADVSSSAYYAQAVVWATEKGITTGYTPTTFGPNNTCTRAQAVTFLYRALAE